MTEGTDDVAAGQAVELIAHRAGNHRGGPDRVRTVADTIELDVRLERGRMVVRHPRRLWFTNRLWEPWHLLPSDAEGLDYEEAVAEVDGDLGLWIDCKGISPRLPARALALAASSGASREAVTVSSKAWWMLGSVDEAAGIRVVRSVSNGLELGLLRFLPSRVKIQGVVARSDLLEKGLVDELKQRYGTLFSWSIPDATTGQRLAAWGVDGLIVDDPEVLDELRRLFQRAEE